MHRIKKIMVAFTAIYCTHSSAQEIFLPDDVWQPIIIYVLIKQPSDAGNLAFTSRQLYRLITEKPSIIKTALAEREDKTFSHYITAQVMRIPVITKPYIEVNEKLLRIVELTLYQEEILKNPYADINYENSEPGYHDDKNKLGRVCSDYPEYKLNWIQWLIDNGARDNNTAHPYNKTALGAIIERYVWYEEWGSPSSRPNVKESCYKIAEMLVKKGGSDPSKQIYRAICFRDAAITKLLIEHGATIKKYDYEWFHDYLHEGNFDENAIKFLLDQGYDPRKHGSHQAFGHCTLLLENAIQAVEQFEPSPKKDRILNLMQQYPKKDKI